MDYKFTFDDGSEGIYHANHKYIRKFVRNGKMVYEYAKDTMNRAANRFMGTAEKARSQEMTKRYLDTHNAYSNLRDKTDHARETAEYKNDVKTYRSKVSEQAKKEYLDAKAGTDAVRNREKNNLWNLADEIELKKAEAKQKKAYDYYIKSMRESMDSAKEAQKAEKELTKSKQIENRSYANMAEAQTRARLAARRYSKTPYARLKKFFGK